MNIEIKKQNDKVSAIVTVKGKDWNSLVTKAEKELFKNFELKGFRKGHVPKEIAQQHIKNENIWNRASEYVIDENHKEVIDLLIKENIIVRPKLNITKISGEEVEIIFESLVMPKIKIGDRSKIDVKYKIDKVSKVEIDNEMKQLDQLLKENVEVKDTKRLIKNGDIVNIDFLGKVDGKEFDGGKSEGFDLTIGSKQFIDNFEDQLVGSKIGDKKTIEVKFPKTYPEPKLADKKAKFDVTINSIKETKDLTGKALKEKLKMLGFESKEELKEKIVKIMEEKKDNDAKDIFIKEYIEAIVNLKDTNINLSKELIEHEVTSELQNFQQKLAEQGTDFTTYLKSLKLTKDQFIEKELSVSANKKLKEKLVFTALVEELKIEATKEEIENEYKKLAKENKAKIEDIKKQVDPGMIESNLVFHKLINILSKK